MSPTIWNRPGEHEHGSITRRKNPTRESMVRFQVFLIIAALVSSLFVTHSALADESKTTAIVTSISLNQVAEPTNNLGITVESSSPDLSILSATGAGDVNNDGRGDLLVLVNDANSTSTLNTGNTVFVIFSNPANPTVDLATLNQGVPRGGAIDGFVINGFQTGITPFGAEPYASAGDFNGDGFDDIIIATSEGDSEIFFRESKGEVLPVNRITRAYIIFGKDDSAPVDVSELVLMNRGQPQNPSFIPIFPPPGDAYIEPMVEGGSDINGDGLSDVVVSVNVNPTPINVAKGGGDPVPATAVAVIFGTTSSDPISLATIVNEANTGGFGIGDPTPGTFFGIKVACIGDTNGDGFDDLLIGAPTGPNGNAPQMKDERGLINSGTDGRAYIVFGKEDVNNVFVGDLEEPSNDAGYEIIPPSNMFNFGAFVSAGSNIDGLEGNDFIVGGFENASLAEKGFGSEQLVLYVIFGKNGGEPVLAESIYPGFELKDSKIIVQDPAGYAIFSETGGQSSITERVRGVGDVDGNGFADILVGQPFLPSQQGFKGDVPTTPGLGRAYVTFGKADGLDVDLTANPILDPVIEIVAEFETQDMGLHVSSLGDINSDGLPDLMVTAKEQQQKLPIPPRGGFSPIGKVYMIYSQGPAAFSATYPGYTKGSDSPLRDFGTLGDGNHHYPDSRMQLQPLDTAILNRGGTPTTKTLNVTLNRDTTPIMNLPAMPISSYWTVEQVLPASVAIAGTLRYTDNELMLLDESQLQMYIAADVTGPWTSPSFAGINLDLNQASFEINGPANTFYVTLGVPVATPTPTPSPSPSPSPTPTATPTATPSPTPTATPTPSPTTTPTLTMTPTPSPSPTPTATPTATPTPTPSPTPTVSPTPTPSPTPPPPNELCFDFTADEEGWTFLSPAEFTASTGQYNGTLDGLDITMGANTNTFAFWESPIFALSDPSIDLAKGKAPVRALQTTMTVKSDVQIREDNPVVRARTSFPDFSHSVLVLAESVNDSVFSPLPPGNNDPLVDPVYTTLVELPIGLNEFRLDFDALNAFPDDAPMPTLTLTQACAQIIIPSDIGKLTTIDTYDLTANNPGFVFESPGTLQTPSTFNDIEGLYTRGLDPFEARGGGDNFETPTIFGSWTADGLYTLPAGGGTFIISADVTTDLVDDNEQAAEQTVPTLRIRVNDGSFNYSGYLNLESVGQDPPLTINGQTSTHNFWFVVPEEVGGNDLIISFDYLYASESGNDPTVGITIVGMTLSQFVPDAPAR